MLKRMTIWATGAICAGGFLAIPIALQGFADSQSYALVSDDEAADVRGGISYFCLPSGYWDPPYLSACGGPSKAGAACAAQRVLFYCTSSPMQHDDAWCTECGVQCGSYQYLVDGTCG
jgi:hypothetical protein